MNFFHGSQHLTGEASTGNTLLTTTTLSGSGSNRIEARLLLNGPPVDVVLAFPIRSGGKDTLETGDECIAQRSITLTSSDKYVCVCVCRLWVYDSCRGDQTIAGRRVDMIIASFCSACTSVVIPPWAPLRKLVSWNAGGNAIPFESYHPTSKR